MTIPITQTEQKVIFANESFYQSFSTGTLEMMEMLWSKKQPVSCIHPGHEPLLEYDEIMESWKNILQQSENTGIECLDPSLSVYGDFSLVTCYEVVSENHLIATNGFVLEDDVWKMVFHQAGPTVGRPDSDVSQQDSGIIN